MLFLRFALLSSTGIGEVIPITVSTRAVAALDMFVGLIYRTGGLAPHSTQRDETRL